MFGYDPCWWYGLAVFFIFVGLNVIVWILRKRPRTAYAVAWLIAAYLIINKVTAYIYNQAIGNHMEFPVEFSTLSYFTFGFLTVFCGKRAGHYGAYCGILAGLVYSVASWLAPNNFAHDLGMRYLLTGAFINHHLMYLGGMLLLADCREYSVRKTWWHMGLGVGAFVAYSWVIHLFTRYSEVMGKPLIIRICDADILLRILPADKINVGIRIVYYLFAIGTVILSMFGFYLLNRLMVRYRARRGLPTDYYASNWDILRNIPLDWRKVKVEPSSQTKE